MAMGLERVTEELDRIDHLISFAELISTSNERSPNPSECGTALVLGMCRNRNFLDYYLVD